MSTPLISVIVPIYNVAQYLDNCVNSIVNQTHKNLEIILVDDGSPDSCPQICDAWAKKDGRIKVIHKQNGGLSSARNAGLDVAAGQYIAFIDGDDTIKPCFCSDLLNEIVKTNSQIAICSFEFIDANTNTVTTQNFISENKVFTSSQVLCDFFNDCDGHLISACNKLYVRSLFETHRFPNGRVTEDWALLPILYHSVKSVCYIPNTNYQYIIHSGSIMRSPSVKRYFDSVIADFEHYNYFNSNGITDYNSNIKAIIGIDFFKLCKAYTPTKQNRQLKKQAYAYVKKINKNKKSALFNLLAYPIHLLFTLKGRLK